MTYVLFASSTPRETCLCLQTVRNIFGKPGEMAFNIYSQSLSTCCDIVSRLSNEIQSLFQDMEVLLKKQISYKSLQSQHKQVLVELSDKFDSLSSNSYHNQNNKRIDDFVLFVKSVWKKLSKYIENDLANAKYYSTRRGTPLFNVVEQLIDFCFHCSYTYATTFNHSHCIKQFNTLTSQLKDVIYPEVEFSDDFEQNYLYVKTVFPCLINLQTIIDIYSSSNKYKDVESFCNDILGYTVQPALTSNTHSPRILSILNCNFLPSLFEVDTSKLKILLPYIDHMTSYILKMSVVPRRIPNGTRLVGVLNSVYMDCTQEENILSQPYHLQFNSSLREIHFRSDGRRRGRRRSRLTEETYSNIRVQLLRIQMQPFAY